MIHKPEGTGAQALQLRMCRSSMQCKPCMAACLRRCVGGSCRQDSLSMGQCCRRLGTELTAQTTRVLLLHSHTTEAMHTSTGPDRQTFRGGRGGSPGCVVFRAPLERVDGGQSPGQELHRATQALPGWRGDR